MHEQYLLAALEQAWLGRGFCAPNPSVGAVAVKDGNIVAQAYHQGAGTPHAEQLLIEKLYSHQLNITEIILYVTLEPCNHWGKTPPCVDVIVNAGIKKVIYAYSDPNPIVKANDTPRLLREHGVNIELIPHPLIDEFYQSYRYWTSTKKPSVTVKLAHTLDGKIAGKNGERVQISNEHCANFTHKQRSHSDVILTTAKTINSDNPLLNVRLGEKTYSKPIAIIEGKEKINPSARIFDTAKKCHIYHSISDLKTIISELGELGYHDVWVEAGATLFNALHRERLVNKTYLYLSPKILGQDAVPAYQQDCFARPHHITWQAMEDNLLVTIKWLGED